MTVETVSIWLCDEDDDDECTAEQPYHIRDASNHVMSLRAFRFMTELYFSVSVLNKNCCLTTNVYCLAFYF